MITSLRAIAATHTFLKKTMSWSWIFVQSKISFSHKNIDHPEILYKFQSVENKWSNCLEKSDSHKFDNFQQQLWPTCQIFPYTTLNMVLYGLKNVCHIWKLEFSRRALFEARPNQHWLAIIISYRDLWRKKHFEISVWIILHSITNIIWSENWHCLNTVSKENQINVQTRQYRVLHEGIN